MKVTKSVTVNNPLAVTYNESTSYVYSKVKCLTKLDGCQLQIVPFIPTEISYSEDKLHDWDAVAVKQKRQLNYFSTMASGSFSQKIKYNTQYRVSEKKLTFVTESLTYMNNNPSIKKIMNTSNNDNIYLIVRTEKDRPRSEAAQFNGEIFIEIDESRSYIAYIEKGRNYKYNIEGKVELEFLKTGSPPADIEKMLFADDLEVILLGEDAVKTTDQVKEDTKNTADSSSSFPVWAIAVIAVASVIVIVSIIVGVIICVKKC